MTGGLQTSVYGHYTSVTLAGALSSFFVSSSNSSSSATAHVLVPPVVLGVPSASSQTVYTLPTVGIQIVVPPGAWGSRRRSGGDPPSLTAVVIAWPDATCFSALALCPTGPALILGPPDFVPTQPLYARLPTSNPTAQAYFWGPTVGVAPAPLPPYATNQPGSFGNVWGATRSLDGALFPATPTPEGAVERDAGEGGQPTVAIGIGAALVCVLSIFALHRWRKHVLSPPPAPRPAKPETKPTSISGDLVIACV